MFFKKRTEVPFIQLQNNEGRQIPMHLTFTNGEIHINSQAMEKGSYLLTIIKGKIRESRSFIVA